LLMANSLTKQEVIHQPMFKAAIPMITQDEINRRVYHAPDVIRSYTSWTLTRAEAVALLKYQTAFAGRDVLDLGVGTGRTAIYLAPLARRYEAIDYSPAMVEQMRSNFPRISVRLGDIRDLSMFEDASFDFVFGPNNVLDAVSHEDRLGALAEIRRVLRPGGVVIFSSHHRLHNRALSGPRLHRSRNPITQARNLVQWIVQLSNHRRIAGLRRIEADYALLNDEGHDYACLHYYIDQRHQRDQLKSVGLSPIDVLDAAGQSMTETDEAAESPWLTFVANRTN
jgi:SAM-dependent methyltransferase